MVKKTGVRENPSSVTDSIVHLKNAAFLIAYRNSGDVSSVQDGIRELNRAEIYKTGLIKILVVPYMHELGRQYCKEANISWLDLSGNADITGPGIRILIEDQPNQFKRPGRRSGAFAPKSSRVARFLLYNHPEGFSQREIAEQTGLGEGYISKIVKSLENADLISRDESGRLTSRDPALLLDAWLEKYDFTKHHPIRGYIPARSGQELLQHIRDSLNEEEIDFAVTGLGAAWQYTQFASFRTVTIYIREEISGGLLSKLDFSETAAAANTIIAAPNDPSVFWEMQDFDGIPCVHPIQVFLDLKTQPERAQEAMPEIKKLLVKSYLG